MTDDANKGPPGQGPPGGMVPGAPPGAVPEELPPSVDMEQTLKWFQEQIQKGSDEPGVLDSDDHLGD